MGGMSPALQQLIDAGSYAAQPTDADRERVFEAIQDRLGLAVGVAGAAGAVPLASGLESVSGTMTLRTVAKTAVGVVLMVAGFAILHWLPSVSWSGRAAHWAIPAADGTTSIAAAASIEATPMMDGAGVAALNQREVGVQNEAGLQAPQVPVTPAVAPAAARGLTRDSLSEEVEILTRAEKELHSGRAERALLLLNEHERKFKNGALTEERTAARVQALCALGRAKEANALFGKLSPQSLHGESTRQACMAARNAASDR